jgi:anti-sigma B factor antagonist/stage II sporulation protein AA (anti-sigma F factor antagonist)
MEFASRRYAEVAVAAPVGRIDHASAEAFRLALEPMLAQCAAGSDAVLLDFSGVEYISSVGLRVLMMAAKQARAQKGTVVIAAMQPVVKEIFDISRFSFVFEAFDSVPAALARFSPAAQAAYQA